MKIKFLPLLLLALFGCQPQQSPTRIPVIHFGDLPRPHGDPDGHFDLACDFAFSKMGYTDLRGVVLDGDVNGDIVAVAQLNYLTGQAVPVTQGQKEVGQEPGNGLLLLKKELETSREKVSILIEGRCTEIAEAARLWPELFRTKVRAVYLSAGNGLDDPEFPMECNAALNPEMYHAMFDLPCPVYWFPCYHIQHDCTVGKNGGLFAMKQYRVLDNLRPEVYNYFRSMLKCEESTRWIAALEKPIDPEERAELGRWTRIMYTTPGLFHEAGLTVWKDGTVAPVGKDPDKEVFRFIPIKVTCSEEGRTEWTPDSKSKDRFILEITDTDLYEEAMTRALAEVLSWI